MAYMIAKENLSFTKMKGICELEERHGTDLGAGYKNDRSCATFVEFIAREQLESVVLILNFLLKYNISLLIFLQKVCVRNTK